MTNEYADKCTAECVTSIVTMKIDSGTADGDYELHGSKWAADELEGGGEVGHVKGHVHGCLSGIATWKGAIGFTSSHIEESFVGRWVSIFVEII